MNSKWCPLPWIHMAIRNNGDLRVCCQANTSENGGIYHNQNGQAYNCAQSDFYESRNCQMAKDIRKSMLRGEVHEACARCDREDASGMSSRRQYERRNWENVFNYEQAKNLTHVDGTIEADRLPVMYYDIRFGNLCNLKCRMCGPTDSSKWYSDQVKVWGNTYKDSHGLVKLIEKKPGVYSPEVDGYKWFEEEFFWQHMEGQMDHIKHLYMVGGEPLLISQHFEFLEKCVARGVAGNIVLEYNSNITQIPDKAWELWRQFKRIQFGVSVDGMGMVNDYIRFPSRWENIEKNLRKLDMAEGNFVVWLACTVQAYNILYLPDFIKWKLESGFSRINSTRDRRLITPHPLHNPSFLNVKMLPTRAKQMVLGKFEEFFPWLEQWLSTKEFSLEVKQEYQACAQSIFKSYADYMMKEDWSHLVPKFLNYTQKLDQLRGQSIEEALPELYEWLKEPPH